jgi:membrane protein YqaA with SNARE-associated domain
MNWIEQGYTGLFLLSFLSATIVPLSSEGLLLLMLAMGFDPWLCLLFASVGNILGGVSNYWLGRLGNPAWIQKLGVSEKKLLSFENRIRRFGDWLAFLSWVPIIGDPLTVALGFFRANWWRVLLWMSLSKTFRYLILCLPWL